VKPYVDKFSEEFAKNSSTLVNEFLNRVDIAQRDVISELALPLVMHNLGSFYHRSQDVEEWISWGPDVWTASGTKRDGSVLHSYLDRIYEEAITSPSDDIWSELANLKVDGEVISPLEFRGIAGVMLAGGRDTVVKLLTGMMWHFGNFPADLEWLRAEPQFLDSAVNEFLRYLTPLPAMARTTVPETGSQDLPADRYVSMSFLSANFDSNIFPNPAKIDLMRERNPHLSFGFGPHTCIGNHLAENEAKIFIEALINTNMSWQVSAASQINFYEGELSLVPQHFSNLYLTNISRRET
jgi:cytochrome P450